MQQTNPSDILTSKSCINKIYNCNEFIFNLDNMLDFKGNISEEKERAEYLSNITDCELTHCCDKNDNDNYYLLSADIKNKYYKINVETNIIISYSDYNKLKTEDKLKYRCPTSYDICKYGLDKELPECPIPMCNTIQSFKHPFKAYENNMELITLQNKLVNIIKDDNILLLEKSLMDYKINQPLLVSYHHPSMMMYHLYQLYSVLLSFYE